MDNDDFPFWILIHDFQHAFFSLRIYSLSDPFPKSSLVRYFRLWYNRLDHIVTKKPTKTNSLALEVQPPLNPKHLSCWRRWVNEESYLSQTTLRRASTYALENLNIPVPSVTHPGESYFRVWKKQSLSSPNMKLSSPARGLLPQKSREKADFLEGMLLDSVRMLERLQRSYKFKRNVLHGRRRGE